MWSSLSDGQATLGNTVMKGNVKKKVRRLYNISGIIALGFCRRAAGLLYAVRDCLGVNWKCIRAIWSKPPFGLAKTESVPITTAAQT